MKSAGNGGVVQSRLQVLHVHVFLAAPLGARRVAKSGADQHQGRVAVRERPQHARPPTDLPVQPLDHVVGADARPMLAGKIAVGQRFLNAVLDLLSGLLQLHGAQLGDHGLRLLAGRFLALLGVDRLEHFCHNFDLGFGHNAALPAAIPLDDGSLEGYTLEPRHMERDVTGGRGEARS